MTLDRGLVDIGQCRGPPTRVIVFVDDHGPHTLVEIVPMDDTRHYAEFHAHARFEIPRLASSYLRQRQLETERRFRTYYGGGFFCPICVSTGGIRFTIEAGENVFDHVPCEQPVDRGPSRHD